MNMELGLTCFHDNVHFNWLECLNRQECGTSNRIFALLFRHRFGSWWKSPTYGIRRNPHQIHPSLAPVSRRSRLSSGPAAATHLADANLWHSRPNAKKQNKNAAWNDTKKSHKKRSRRSFFLTLLTIKCLSESSRLPYHKSKVHHDFWHGL